jgi:hypothetical protein
MNPQTEKLTEQALIAVKSELRRSSNSDDLYDRQKVMDDLNGLSPNMDYEETLEVVKQAEDELEVQ